MERLLALGSVVKVQMRGGGVQRLMIAGYFPKDKKTGRSYDYAAVPYPYGMRDMPVIRTFNRPQILETEHQGYLDERAEIYTMQLPMMLERMKEVLTQKLASVKEETAAGASASPVEPAGADTPFG